MKTIEETYQKRSQQQHILLQPKTCIGTNMKNKQNSRAYEGDKMVNRDITFIQAFTRFLDEILVNAADNKAKGPFNEIFCKWKSKWTIIKRWQLRNEASLQCTEFTERKFIFFLYLMLKKMSDFINVHRPSFHTYPSPFTKKNRGQKKRETSQKIANGLAIQHQDSYRNDPRMLHSYRTDPRTLER